MPGWSDPPRDLAALLALAGVLAALLVYVALLAPTRLDFGVAQPPRAVVFRGFYGLERNAADAYLWSKPQASLAVPVAAPADYRITLTLQDSPAAPPRRPVTVYVDGAVAGTITLDATPHAYTFAAPLDPGAWAGRVGRTVQLELSVAPFVPPNDQRALGVILTRVAVAPQTPVDHHWLLVLAPPLTLLAFAYAALRLAGLRSGWCVAALGSVLAGYGVLAATRRGDALALAAQPAAQPAVALSLALALAAIPLLVRPLLRARVAAAGSASGGCAAGDGGHFWARGSWPLLPVLVGHAAIG